MFLLNLIDADFLHKIQKFTIQNVPIKSHSIVVLVEKITTFTIQNVPIKSILFPPAYLLIKNLQYKMFLLNLVNENERLMKKINLQYKMFLLNITEWC